MFTCFFWLKLKCPTRLEVRISNFDGLLNYVNNKYYTGLFIEVNELLITDFLIKNRALWGFGG